MRLTKFPFSHPKAFFHLAKVAHQATAVLKTSTELETSDHLINNQAVNFEDCAKVFAAKPTSNLIQSYAILKACRLKTLVVNAETLLSASKTVLGPRFTEACVGNTFFKHFCAGTNSETIKPTVKMLQRNGIMPILNFAAEDDVSHADEEGAQSELSLAEEKSLDAHARVFMRSILDCDNSQPGRGFVGIKMTALGQPNLLERISQILGESGEALDRGHSSANLRSLMSANLDQVELRAFDNLVQRLTSLAGAVHQKGHMRILVDAEQSYMQPAIDALTIALQQTYNRSEAVIMNTYQCYLKDSAGRIERDLARAREEGWTWGAKTVRGAYMHLERARASQTGCDSPVHDSISATHHNYDRCVDFVMDSVVRGAAELMVASHNQTSIEAAIHKMGKLGIRSNSPGSGVYFGQLLGMADNLSYPLGAHGYNIYKICAYGSVNETVAYLLRRALENSDALGGCSKEISMIKNELLRRMNPMRAFWPRRDPHPNFQPA